MEQVLTFKGGRHQFQYDGTLNDSSKAFVVPVGHQYHLRGVFVRLVSDATAGNRRMLLAIQNATPTVIARFYAATEQAASLTYYYTFVPGVGLVGTVYQYIPIPEMIIPQGYTLLVQDDAAVSAAGDDMYVTLIYDDEVLG